MDITFNCTKCGQHLVVDEAGAGLSVPCPKCGNELTIPTKPLWLPVINEKLQEIIRQGKGGSLPKLRDAIEKAGYDPARAGVQPGSPEDLLCRERLDLILDTNFDTGVGFANAQRENDPDIVDAYPAWELVQGGYREHHRGDPCYESGTPGAIGWKERWQEAAEKSGDYDALRAFKNSGRMAALKSSGIWQRLGNLWGDSIGNPYHPFAWDSSMCTEEVDRDDADNLGLIGLRDEAKPQSGLTPPQFIPIEDARMTEWLLNQPEECGHCGEAKPRRILTDCETCEDFICPDCKAKGCEQGVGESET